MGSQPLSAKRTRFYERQTGLSLDRVLSHGGTHWKSFRTPEHRHGQFLMTESGPVINWIPEKELSHWTSCRERFPNDFSPNPPYEYLGRHH